MKNLDGISEWHQELRSGIFRALTFYRSKLNPDGPRLDGTERQGLVDLLTLLGEIVSSIEPVPRMTSNESE